MNKILNYLDRNKKSILVWGLGALLYWLTTHGYRKDNLAEEYNLVTWDEIDHVILFGAIFLICKNFFLKPDSLFVNDEKNAWAEKIREDISLSEKKMKVVIDYLQNEIDTNKEFRERLGQELEKFATLAAEGKPLTIEQLGQWRELLDRLKGVCS